MDCKAINYKNIPVQPDIISGIVHLDVESTTCFRDLDRYVHSDQGVVTLVLRVVNSALYFRGSKIATIPKAISILGFQVVRSLAMLAFSRSLFSLTSNPLFRTHIWQHSLLTAMAGQTICHALGDEKQKDEAFIAGLMHDIGKLLLFAHDPNKYLEVLHIVLKEACLSAEAEQRVYGCDHYQVGVEAVSQWQLPERFVGYMGSDLGPKNTNGMDPFSPTGIHVPDWKC
jgi:putative nucleotidyltransferase with HDIG domain